MWTQTYDPLGNIFVSALAATVPIAFLFWALAVRKMKGHVAGLCTTALAVAVAIVVYRMPASRCLATPRPLFGVSPPA